jgi:protein phosphatase
MRIAIPELSLVLLVGPSGCGKSTFAAKHFRSTEVISSDFCRALVSDDEMDQSATTDAFEVLHFIARRRLARGRLTVVDATNTQPAARKPLIELAKEAYLQAVAIVFDLPPALCEERNRARQDRQVPPYVTHVQRSQLERSLRDLQREGFRRVFYLRSPEEVDAVEIVRERLWPDRRDETGPFDIIGDIHGCADELEELFARLGYVEADGVWKHPDNRKVVFLGDLVDRGPRVPDVLRIAMDMVRAGTALCVPGNHDDKLKRWLQGKKVRIAHGLEQSIEQLEREPAEFRERALAFLDGLVSHAVLDGGRLVVAHAGMKREMQGRASGHVREFALYGETTGESDEFGLPVRYNWAADYRGEAMVVYGHTPVHRPEWLNNTINIDTGCVFGGHLTALRYPERELLSVPARRTYREASKPFVPAPGAEPALSAQQKQDELLELQDISGKRIVSTRLRGDVTIREENATAALEVMSRFAADPRWLIYLPPTMSPSETADPQAQPGYLEHPTQAFAHYRREGAGTVVCQEKHMGSRAVAIVCRDEEAAHRRFGVKGETGIVLTRTGRRFFEGPDRELEAPLLAIIRDAIDRAGLWDELSTDWVCLDAELMPWSAKARELIRDQYASAGAAARGMLPEAVSVLEQGAARGLDLDGLPERFRNRRDLAVRYEAAYRRYSWPVASVADLRLAPFHLLASEGVVHADKDHLWHMSTLARLAVDSPVVIETRHRTVDLADSESEAAAVRWWEEMTEAGGEGMVIKPLAFLSEGRKGLAQPALKCRGREYLRIIYGPEYTLPENLERLRTRGLSAKRSLALRELALGIEALERFVRREPLRRVHECVFGVLALESEPVDPRL